MQKIISFLKQLIYAKYLFKMSTGNNMKNVFMKMYVTSDVLYGF